ncbi:hypothetical protein MPSI1_001618 [Malassezia psittaci]|uniref:Uncharacterized protein n=1 Tax=Malassezia psittaci TaxID=1821823 RepID=A0AAF0FE08_9BASI|nr:hypothetical protein MPSI1_001618 [Malassezia psittaci]
MADAPPTATLSPYNVFWLVHVIMELPMGILAFLSPADLPVRDLTPSTVLLARVLGAFLIASSISSLLMFGLPDFLPGKRAAAVQLLLFHAIVSSIYLQLDNDVLHVQLPAVLANNSHVQEILSKVSISSIVGILHGVLSLLITVWWQATIPQVKGAAQMAHAKSQ